MSSNKNICVYGTVSQIRKHVENFSGFLLLPPPPLRSISVSLCAGSRSSLDSLPVFLSLSVQSTTVSSSRHTPITFSLPTSFLFLVQVDTNYIFRVLLVSFLGSSISWIYCEYSWVPGDGFGSKLFSVL